MADQETMTGKVFSGRYEVQDRIGVGGMAEVYRAQDQTLGRVVAVKVMLPQFAADPAFTKRFRQEAAAAANLQSPYIVNVYDWGHDDDTYFIVMELVRGSDLKTAILQRGAINQRKVAEIGSQVCQALSVAHNQDIIHRDIKPQNIMVQPDGNVKVMDFGIARAKNSVSDKTGAVLGTAHYISPEQAQGKDLTAASDIYSLGVVLYEAATGKLPFDGPDAVSVALQQVKEEPELPSTINPAIDPELEDIIMVAMAKDPSERFATANDMRIALNDYLAGRAVTLPDGVVGSGFTEAQTRVMSAVGTPMVEGTQIMPTVSNATSPGMTGTFSPTGYRDGNMPRRTNKKPLIIALVAVLAIALIGVAAFALANGGSSEESNPVEVPNVVGSSQAEAEFAIKQAGFEPIIEQKHDDSVEVGTVISQNPVAGKEAQKGDSVTITVSQGTDKVAVPSLFKMTPEEAEKAAAAVGLRAVERESKYSDEIEAGLIMEQSTNAGDMVDPGTVIEYVISRGTQETTAPNVVGSTEEEATNTLKGEGFGVAVERAFSDDVKEGRVIKQSPLKEKVKKGDTITITVSKGPEEKEVPSVVGQTEDAASTAIEAAGFTVSSKGEYSSTVEEGLVISQSPSSGNAAPGATITITVSMGPDPATVSNPDSSTPPDTTTPPDATSQPENSGQSDPGAQTSQSPTEGSEA